ncbi:HNH endonuclease domain-containing protein [Nodosilinea nodulosa]|uniref:HNH endonuclease domain-containing protein n=1 Tax=Nodosilinea nodulosa TaxID=416001 RepID=UPI0002DF27B4|nr:HNH endonuclease domain-containing protein [Nodosilinea nodulosa]
MGKAGDALRQTLEGHGISQNQLAAALEVPRPTIFRWFHGQVDPTAETVVTIVEALRGLDAGAADEFVRLYLGNPSPTQANEVSIVSGQSLPTSEQVNVAALTRIFADTTSSYKYLFFLSLLDILKRRHFEVLSPISFQEMIVEMLANAWFPHTFFKLSFGAQDQIANKLDSLALVIEEPIVRFKDTDKTLLRKAIASQNLKDAVLHLRRYVPFRLIIPFVESELVGVSRGKGNQLDMAMPVIADRCFDICKPLYRFDSIQYKDCQGIIVHPAWASYLEQHYTIVRGWAAWEWLGYMQKRNPSTPAISNKLFMPVKRDSLAKQTEYWKLVMQSQELRCIYSGQVIDPNQFSLDHYLPWSFVAHDQLWNLVPTLQKVNSAKSNSIPSNEYFRDFVLLQHKGLTIAHGTLTEGKWAKQVEPYISNLSVSDRNELLNVEKLSEAYQHLLKPLISLASTQGFSFGWQYRA